MTDVRALLKAKRQEVRVNHPLASYTSSGQLRCVACGTIVKQSSSWQGHVGSKAHRTNAARLREEEHKRALVAEAAKVSGKRKMDVVADGDAEQSDGEDDGDATQDMTAGTKRMKLSAAHDERGRGQSTPPTTDPNSKSASGFPADFFSDPSQAPPPASDDEDEDEPMTAPPAPSAPGEAASSAIDAEWALFEQEVLKNSESTSKPDDQTDAYGRATIFAEPELASEVPEGFPPLQGDDAGEGADGAAPVLTEEEQRRLREQDDRELIMDRLLEEERAQEEADAKVVVLKNRLDALRRQREAKKAAKAGKAQP